MPSAKRGEVWIVDLGLTAKVRPCVVLSTPPGSTDRALVTVIPHTTSCRGSAYEVVVVARFLRHAGAFDAQNPVTVSSAKLIRRIGTLTLQELSPIEETLRKWLGFDRTVT